MKTIIFNSIWTAKTYYSIIDATFKGWHYFLTVPIMHIITDLRIKFVILRAYIISNKKG